MDNINKSKPSNFPFIPPSDNQLKIEPKIPSTTVN